MRRTTVSTRSLYAIADSIPGLPESTCAFRDVLPDNRYALSASVVLRLPGSAEGREGVTESIISQYCIVFRDDAASHWHRAIQLPGTRAVPGTMFIRVRSV